MTDRSEYSLTSSTLHILAMALMLCDHMWATLFPAAEWLTCLGRIAFPIFAFMIAEGYACTKDLRRYLLRLFLWACLTEIPFDLMYGGSSFYPFHQNVLWTFLLSLLLLRLTDFCYTRFRPLPAAAFSVVIALLGYVLGYAVMSDYYGPGVLTVFVFHFIRGRTWKHRLLQFLCLYILNVKMLGGYCYGLQLFGHEFELVQQGFALLALVPIWLYRGRQGFHSRAFRYFCYAFYPAHIIVLLLVRNWML